MTYRASAAIAATAARRVPYYLMVSAAMSDAIVQLLAVPCNVTCPRRHASGRAMPGGKASSQRALRERAAVLSAVWAGRRG